MDFSTLGIAMGSAWLSGINLYATVLTLGLLQRFHLAHLPGDLTMLGQTWVVVAAAVLFTIQFVADKIPAVDSAWDVVHTFIRVPAGAILAASAFAHFDPGIRLLALLIGGGVAFSSHIAKTASRLAANTSPEPFSNIFLSLFGDALSIVGTLLVTWHPILLLGVTVFAVILSIWISYRIYAGLKRLFGNQNKPDYIHVH